VLALDLDIQTMALDIVVQGIYKMASNVTLLVDARNLMYRAIFASKKSQYTHQHSFTVMLRFMCSWIDRFKPTNINIFWDTKRSLLWRRKIFEGYKDKQENKYFVDIRDELISTQAIAKAMFAYLGCRQFSKDHMEADDLIYACCKVMAPSPIIICSSDSDYSQIVFRMSHVKCFDPMHETFIQTSDFDPVIQKALCGDKADCIDGYVGIGPVKSTAMAKSSKDRAEFLTRVGIKLFIRNMLLVDMSLCPELLKNQLYVQRILDTQPVFNKDKLFDLAHKYKISGFVTEYSRLASRFKHFIIPAEPINKDDEK
jgi:5'-3' exonuclease